MRLSSQSSCRAPKLRETFNGRYSSAAFILLFSWGMTPAFAADIYAPWLTQIGLNETILSNAKWGHGVKLGIVDTGINSNANYFTKGQLSNNLSSCAAVTFSCVNGYADELGHGTAVAAVAAGNQTIKSFSSVAGYTVLPNSVMSVAPSSNLISIKVFDQDHPVITASDVASGIIRAADAGANVINVSITYSSTSEEVAAINYAASKGAYIVWSAGNEHGKINEEYDTLGISPEAIKRFIFAGSVNYANVKSDFSNTPATGGFNALGVITPYAYRTLYAPGEAVLAPDITNGAPVYFKYWDGTSFSAPIVTASLGLLINTWPILKTEGTAAELLLATATNLGIRGVDATYGSGLINLATAFQPYGDLTMKGAKGRTYTTKEMTGSLLTSGALGKLSSIKKKLKKYNAFDEFNRNFTVNMYDMVKNSRARPILNALPTFKKKKPKALKLADGTVFTSWQTDEEDISHLGEFGHNVESDYSQQASYLAFESEDGTSLSYGYDYPAEIAYQQMLYGQEESSDFLSHFTDDLTGIAEGGKLFAFGIQLAPKTRLGMTWNSNLNDIQVNAWNQTSQASNLKLGLSHQLSAKLSGAISVGMLKEEDGLLGSQYQNNGLLSFSHKNDSVSLDFSAIYKFNQHHRLLLEAGYAMTKRGDAGGLIAGTSNIFSNYFGATYLSKNVFEKEDQLSLSIKQPLRVTRGSASMLISGTDALGYATYQTESVSLTPDGREIDVTINYEKPIDEQQALGLQAAFRKDVQNIRGESDASIGMSYRLNF